MPRIVPYRDPEQGMYDLIGGLAGGFLQGASRQLISQQEREQQQRDAAFGNPYQRLARTATWASLPEDIRSAPNAPLYQNLIASGADPLQVMGAHKELQTDPAYGDPETQKARRKALDVAMKAGHVAADDEATKEAVLRGEMTLGKLISRRDAQTEKQGDRTYSEGLDAKKQTEKKADEAARAATLQEALGVGRPQQRGSLVVPTGGANFTQVPLPPKPGQTFTDPEDVKTVASETRMRESAATAATQKEQALSIQKQRLDQARQNLARASGRADLTPEQRTRVEAALEVMNDAGATEAEYAQAFVVAREFGFAPQAAAIQKQSPQEEMQSRLLQNEIANLQDLKTKMLSPDGDDWVQNWAKQNGLKPSGTSQTTGRPTYDLREVVNHVQQTIDALKEKLVTPATPAQPAAAPTDSPDPPAAAAVDAMMRMMQNK